VSEEIRPLTTVPELADPKADNVVVDDPEPAL
jgi:hypothetical protein